MIPNDCPTVLRHGELVRTGHGLEHRVERMVRDAVANSRANALKGLDGEPVRGEPLVGFASGDDPLFVFLRDYIGEVLLDATGDLRSIASRRNAELHRAHPGWSSRRTAACRRFDYRP